MPKLKEADVDQKLRDQNLAYLRKLSIETVPEGFVFSVWSRFAKGRALSDKQHAALANVRAYHERLKVQL